MIPNKESDLERFDNDVFAPFLLHAYQIRLTVGYEYEIQEIIISIAGIRKTMYNLRMDSNYFADHLKQKYEKYYSEEGEYFKRLPKLKQDLQIDDSLSESNN